MLHDGGVRDVRGEWRVPGSGRPRGGRGRGASVQDEAGRELLARHDTPTLGQVFPASQTDD